MNDVTFHRIEDNEGDRNRGWQVDMIEARQNGETVGYLKMSYVPTHRFEERYPSVLEYLSLIKGHSLIPKDYNLDSPAEPTFRYDDREGLLYNLSFKCERWGQSLRKEEIEEMGVDEIEERITEYTIQLEEEYGNHFQDFQDYHVDKPLVDYIYVEESHRRQGIGFALYCEGAKWMGDKGMRLYASTLQTDDAQAAWEKNRRELNTGTEVVEWMGETKERTFIQS